MQEIIEALLLLSIGILIGVIIMNNKEALDELKAEVQQGNSVVESAVVLIQGLSNRLAVALASATGDDLVAEIQEIRDTLDGEATTLANAVASNTPSEGDSADFPPAASSGSTDSTDTPDTSTTPTDETTGAGSDSAGATTGTDTGEVVTSTQSETGGDSLPGESGLTGSDFGDEASSPDSETDASDVDDGA
jgi:hypothetical protein